MLFHILYSCVTFIETISSQIGFSTFFWCISVMVLSSITISSPPLLTPITLCWFPSYVVGFPDTMRKIEISYPTPTSITLCWFPFMLLLVSYFSIHCSFFWRTCFTCSTHIIPREFVLIVYSGSFINVLEYKKFLHRFCKIC